VPPLHVAVGGVEERDAQVHRAVHGRDLHLVVALAEIRRGAARAEADRGDRRGRSCRACGISLLALRHFPVAELHHVAPEAMPPVLPGIELGRCGGDLWRIPRGKDNGLLGHAGLICPALMALISAGVKPPLNAAKFLVVRKAVRPLPLPSRPGDAFPRTRPRTSSPQFRVRELDLLRGFADFRHFASRGEEVALLVVGRVDLGRLLEPDVVRGCRAGPRRRRCSPLPARGSPQGLAARAFM